VSADPESWICRGTLPTRCSMNWFDSSATVGTARRDVRLVRLLSHEPADHPPDCMQLERGSGILLHVSSLPSRYGIGDLGPGAYRFLDFLHAAGQRVWQVLP